MIADKAGRNIVDKVDVSDAPELAADMHLFPELASFAFCLNRCPMLWSAFATVKHGFSVVDKENALAMDRLKSSCGSGALSEHICRMCTPYRSELARHLWSRLHLEREYTVY